MSSQPRQILYRLSNQGSPFLFIPRFRSQKEGNWGSKNIKSVCSYINNNTNENQRAYNGSPRRHTLHSWSYTSGMEIDGFEATDPGHEWGAAMRSMNMSALRRHLPGDSKLIERVEPLFPLPAETKTKPSPVKMALQSRHENTVSNCPFLN